MSTNSRRRLRSTPNDATLRGLAKVRIRSNLANRPPLKDHEQRLLVRKLIVFSVLTLLLSGLSWWIMPSSNQFPTPKTYAAFAGRISDIDGLENLSIQFDNSLTDLNEVSSPNIMNISWKADHNRTFYLVVPNDQVLPLQVCGFAPSETIQQGNSTISAESLRLESDVTLMSTTLDIQGNDPWGYKTCYLNTYVSGSGAYRFFLQPPVSLAAPSLPADTSFCVEVESPSPPPEFRINGSLPVGQPISSEETVRRGYARNKLVWEDCETGPFQPSTTDMFGANEASADLPYISVTYFSDIEKDHEDKLVFVAGVLLGIAGGLIAMIIDAALSIGRDRRRRKSEDRVALMNRHARNPLPMRVAKPQEMRSLQP